METLPPSVWIAGCFNPMGFVTATLQVTARAQQLSLDQMRVHTEVTDIYDTDAVEGQPEIGANVHGFFMENARWDPEAAGSTDMLENNGTVPVDPIFSAKGSVVDSKPKELYPVMPMLLLTGRTVDNSVPGERVTDGRYVCPICTTTIRGPTFVFAGPLRTNVDAKKWILAGAALVMQPD